MINKNMHDSFSNNLKMIMFVISDTMDLLGIGPHTLVIRMPDKSIRQLI